jgi:hypothetical protein
LQHVVERQHHEGHEDLGQRQRHGAGGVEHAAEGRDVDQRQRLVDQPVGGEQQHDAERAHHHVGQQRDEDHGEGVGPPAHVHARQPQRHRIGQQRRQGSHDRAQRQRLRDHPQKETVAEDGAELLAARGQRQIGERIGDLLPGEEDDDRERQREGREEPDRDRGRERRPDE